LTVYAASIDTKHTEENQLLRSSDFFDVDRFPTMHFVSTAASLRPDGLLDVIGDLTIRGITRRLVVRIVVRSGDAFETTFQIDRTELGLNGSPKLSGFNVSIGRKVHIHIAMHVAKPQGSMGSGR
jgi:polyisoprenoid-binding protein YceI